MVAMRCLERRITPRIARDARGVTPRIARPLELGRMRVYESLNSALDPGPMDVLGRRERQTDHGRHQKTRYGRSCRSWHGRRLDLISMEGKEITEGTESHGETEERGFLLENQSPFLRSSV
jgi:hypothetical protein